MRRKEAISNPDVSLKCVSPNSVELYIRPGDEEDVSLITEISGLTSVQAGLTYIAVTSLDWLQDVSLS